MSHLAQYCDEKNLWRALKKKKLLSPRNVTPTDKKYLLECIECDLSPENLCCDGEASPAYVRQRSRMLLGAQAELEALKGYKNA